MSIMAKREKWLVNSRLMDAWHRKRLRSYLAAAPEIKGKAIELGCGWGSTSAEVLSRYPTVNLTATDFDEGQLTKAKQRFPNISFQQADAQNLQFKDKSFDAVFAFDAHHHIEDWKKALKEEFRVLKPRGRLFILDFGRPRFYRILYKILPHVDFRKNEFVKEVETAGFKIEKLTTGFVFWLEAIKA